jgi:hypothetical protein
MRKEGAGPGLAQCPIGARCANFRQPRGFAGEEKAGSVLESLFLGAPRLKKKEKKRKEKKRKKKKDI